MRIQSYLSAAAIVTAIALPGSTLAQDGHMISGKAVPADQVAEVQNKCDELRKADPGQKTPEAEAPAGETAAPPADRAEDGSSQPAGASGWMEDGTRIDLESLTIALCDEGNFVAPAM